MAGATHAGRDDARNRMAAHILVVDDEPGIRAMLTTWLEGAGYDCTAAADASEAVHATGARSVDVALLDLALQGTHGVWLARELRAMNSDTALIMVTGLHRSGAAVGETMRLDAMDYLPKPFSRRQLLDSVGRAVAWRDSTLQQRRRLETLERQIQGNSEALARAFTVLESASAEALASLLVTLETRNPEVCTHARRVAHMAVGLARALDVGEQDVSHIERGALLHDIGKVAMPDALIHKPGPLTEEEIAIIRTHARVGRDIIAVVPSLREAARIVLHSHEAWDGSGYPDGLSGTEIPLGSRITAVVDTFDALTWCRAYRDPVCTARAAAELMRCAGTQFDPDIVDTWLRVAEYYVRGPAAEGAERHAFTGRRSASASSG
jgi:putative nucleotidyltransferase with HDIG domain